MRLHLREIHVGNRTIEKIAHYDQQAADILSEELRDRLLIDAIVRQTVTRYVKRGVEPKYISALIELGLRYYQTNSRR